MFRMTYLKVREEKKREEKKREEKRREQFVNGERFTGGFVCPQCGKFSCCY